MQRLQAQNSYERGLAQASQGQSALALSSFQEAVSLNPKSGLYRDALGLLLLDLGRVEPSVNELKEAIEELQQAVRLNPDMAEARYTLGITYWQSGDFEKTKQWRGESTAHTSGTTRRATRVSPNSAIETSAMAGVRGGWSV